MSNDLIITTGGGAVVPASTGGAVGEHIGDISVDRGHAPAGAVERPAGVSAGHQLIVGDLISQLNLTEDQKHAAVTWLGRNIGRLEELREEALIEERVALDQREKAEAVATMRGKWGAAYEGNVREIHEWLLDSLGKDATEELLRARDFDGTAILNKTDFLESLLEAARATLSSDDTADRAEAERAMRAEWRGNYDVDVGLIRRYVDGLPQTVQDAIFWARDQHGVLLLNRPAGLRWLLQLATRHPVSSGGGPSPDLSARRRELEGWMEKRDPRYWKDEAAQAEYRELLDQGVGSDVLPKTADADVTGRIAQIEALMGKSNSEYYRGSNADALQRELRELYDRRDQRNRRR